MTAKQKQNLLAYLGLYNGEIDGDFGPASQEATRKFQRERNLTVDGDFGPKTEEEMLKVIGQGIKINTTTISTTSNTTANTSSNTVINNNNTGVFAGIKYFTEVEFVCKCGGKYCKGDTATMDRTLLKVADQLREELGVVVVTSGIRCPVHNANEGGVSNSKHLYGKAMDFYVVGKSATVVKAWCDKRSEITYCYIVEGTNNRVVHINV